MRITLPKYILKNDYRISGIYFLIHKNKIVYIGRTTHLFSRVTQHQIKWDSVRIIQCSYKECSKYEKRWIKKFMPKYNKNGWGSFKKLKIAA